MRTLIVLLVAAMAAPALALPIEAPFAPSGLAQVQNRFLPGFLGGDSKARDDLAVRVDRLEAQVRALTGEVERLTFELRRRKAASAPAAPAAPAPAPTPTPETTEGPGAPPRNLGTLPAPASPATGGPIDLSILNEGGGFNVAPGAGAAPRTASTGTDALSNVRALHDAGRYREAAAAARAVLDGAPEPALASAARFRLAEALLASGDDREAASQFLETYTSDPNSKHAPESLLRLSTALTRLGENEAACSTLEELVGAYPDLDGRLRADAERARSAAGCS